MALKFSALKIFHQRLQVEVDNTTIIHGVPTLQVTIVQLRRNKKIVLSDSSTGIYEHHLAFILPNGNVHRAYGSGPAPTSLGNIRSKKVIKKVLRPGTVARAIGVLPVYRGE